jgi:hypothetical protein
LTNIRRDVAIGVSSSRLLTRKSSVARYFLGCIDLGTVCGMRQAQSKKCVAGAEKTSDTQWHSRRAIALRGMTRYGPQKKCK